MKAMVCEAFGGPEVLALRDLPDPPPPGAPGAEAGKGTTPAAALVPGGLLAVSDLFTGGNHPGPVLPELFSLHMLLTATAGRSLPLPVVTVEVN